MADSEFIKEISKDLKIDLHYDLQSWPASLTSRYYGRIVMSAEECFNLMNILAAHFNGHVVSNE